MDDDLTLTNMTKFSNHIEDLVKLGMTYMEALIHYSDDKQVDFETISGLVSQNLKEKIRDEAIRLNMIKGEMDDFFL